MNDDIDYDDIDPNLQQYESSLNEAKGRYYLCSDHRVNNLRLPALTDTYHCYY